MTIPTADEATGKAESKAHEVDETVEPQEVERFKEMAEISGAHVYQLNSKSELTALIKHLANEDDVPVVWLETAANASKPHQLSNFPEPTKRTLGAVVAEYAIAETGSVVLLEATRPQMLHSLLSEELLVLIHQNAIVPTLSATAELITQAADKHQQVTFLTGPSRTGDIELHHVNGIQGPYEVHLAICDFPLANVQNPSFSATS